MAEAEVIKENKLELVVSSDVSKDKSDHIKSVFDPMYQMLKSFEGAYDDLMERFKTDKSEDIAEEAKTLRNKIVKIRTGSDKARKAEKEAHLVAGRAIDGVHNILKFAVMEKEAKLKEVEDYHHNLEMARLNELQAKREKELSEYMEDPSGKNYSMMEDDVYAAFLSAKMQSHAKALADAKKAEQQAKEEAQAKAKLEAENQLLKEEAAAKEAEAAAEIARVKAEAEAKLKAESEKQAAIQKEKDDKAQAIADENARIAAEKEAKAEAFRAEQAAALKKAEEEKLAMEKKLEDERLAQVKKDQEIEAELEAERLKQEELVQAELSKGDEDKKADLILDFKAIKTRYEFDSEANQKMYEDVKKLIDKVIGHINK